MVSEVELAPRGTSMAPPRMAHSPGDPPPSSSDDDDGVPVKRRHRQKSPSFGFNVIEGKSATHGASSRLIIGR